MLDPELVEFFNDFKKEMKDEMNSSFNSFKDEMKSEMNSSIGSLRDEMKSEMNSSIGSLRDEMNSNNNSIRAELDSIKERLTSLENICTIIQEEHTYKLDLLLDYASANIEKHEEYDKKFNKIDNKLFIHDTKLAIIESSDFYQKMIKGKGKSNLRNAML